MCEVLAGTVSPMTGSTVCFGNGANVTVSTVDGVQESKIIRSETAMRWGSFNVQTPAPVFV